MGEIEVRLMGSFEQFTAYVSSSEAGGDFERENVAMKHLIRVSRVSLGSKH